MTNAQNPQTEFSFPGSSIRLAVISTGTVLGESREGVTVVLHWRDGRPVCAETYATDGDEDGDLYAEIGLEWDGPRLLGGYDGVADFPGEVTAALEKCGFAVAAEVTPAEQARPVPVLVGGHVPKAPRPGTEIRYALTHINRDGMRVLTCQNTGRNHYHAASEAAGYLAAFIENNSRKTLVDVFGPQAWGTFRVSAVECYPHGDAAGIYPDPEADAAESAGGFDALIALWESRKAARNP